MNKRDFLATLGVVLLCFIAANFAMAKWTARIRGMQKLDAIEAATKANTLVVGNSLLDYTLDEQVFQDTARSASADLIPLNTAISATSAPEHYLLFSRALRLLPGIHTVVIGFYDFQLTAERQVKVSDMGFDRMVAFNPRVPIRDAESIYAFSPQEKLLFRLFRALPLIAFRFNIWHPVERLRISLGGPEYSMDKIIEEVYGYGAAGFHGTVTHLNAPMDRLIRDAQARHCQVIFVLMPMAPRHLKVCYAQPLWQNYQAEVTRVLAEDRCGFIDATTWFPSPDYFKDSIHLNERAVEPLSVKLANAVVAERSAMRSRWPVQ